MLIGNRIKPFPEGEEGRSNSLNCLVISPLNAPRGTRENLQTSRAKPTLLGRVDRVDRYQDPGPDAERVLPTLRGGPLPWGLDGRPARRYSKTLNRSTTLFRP